MDAGSDYQGGVAPPIGFPLDPHGKIVWDAIAMAGSDDPFLGEPPLPDNIYVLSPDGTDTIQIGNSTFPGGGGTTLAGFQSLYFFNAVNNTYQPAVELLLGDVNRDGLVNLLDVEPFIALLSAGAFQSEADIDGNGVVNLLDVEPFVDLLSG